MEPLDVGKLTSVDKNGDRLYLIPAEVKGFFRKHRTWTQAVLIIIFLILPWTKMNGHQTVLLNIVAREFNIFGVLFRAHDAPLMFFLIAGAALTLAFVTSVWGRLWCGWACPQTVFIDGVFRRIEQLVEGNYLQRRALKTAPLTGRRLIQITTKWVLFFAAASLIAHSFVAYFVGAESLLQIIQKSPGENWTLFLVVTFFTFVFLFDFVWFREQFCVIMCPYGRIQGLLYDQKTQTVGYDLSRGEPRKGLAKEATQKQGDCVDCGRCVSVCPTGIDIRNGLQMECIACTACIDACDEIMEKVKKPKGLIRYMTIDGSKINIFKPRSVLYMIAIILCAVGLSYNLATRQSSHITLMRGQGSPYTLSEEMVINHFKLHITNQSRTAQEYLVQLHTDDQSKNLELVIPQNPSLLASGEIREWHFFVKAPKELFATSNQQKIRLEVIDPKSRDQFQKVLDLTLLGPQN